MNYVIAVYTSRNISSKVYGILLQHRVTVSLVSTPHSVGVGCGLSVRFPFADFPRLKKFLSCQETLVGFFLVKPTKNGTVISKL